MNARIVISSACYTKMSDGNVIVVHQKLKYANDRAVQSLGLSGYSHKSSITHALQRGFRARQV
jgi:hypothetical protein